MIRHVESVSDFNEIVEKHSLVLMDFLQHGADLVKCCIQYSKKFLIN